MEEKRINWRQIIATAVITGVVAVTTGITLFYFQTREPKLTYSLSETIPFEGDEETLAIYHVVIQNEGTKVVENVDCHVGVSPATVKDHRVTRAVALDYTESTSKDTYKIHFANLNPDESVTISVLTSAKLPHTSRPKVTLRGKGIAGKEATQESEKKTKWLNNPIFIAILSAYTVLIALGVMRKQRKFPFSMMGRGLDFDKHSDDQNEVIAYLFNIHGCPDIAEAYLKRHRIPSYWSEADHIAAIAIEETDADMKEKSKKILLDLLSYAKVAPSSQGIIHYNIARIAKHQGNQEESDDHLGKAKKLIPQLLKKRLTLDPLFKKSDKNEAQQPDVGDS